MSVYRRREPDNSSKIAQRYNYKQVGRDLFFLCWNIDVFVSFLVFVSSLENNLLRTHLRRSTTAATSSASFSPLFSLTRTAVNTAAALHFLLVTMNTRSKTDKKERRSNAVGEDRSLSRKSPVFFFEFRSRMLVCFRTFYLFNLKSNTAPFCYHGNCSSQ